MCVCVRVMSIMRAAAEHTEVSGPYAGRGQGGAGGGASGG